MLALVLEDPARPGGTGPELVAANQAFLDGMAEPTAHVERMLRETAWTRAEIEAVSGYANWRGHSDTEVLAEAFALWGL